MIQKIVNSSLQGIINIPSSKSDAQRALLCAALTNGVSEIRNIGKSDDVLSMLNCIKQLGARVKESEDSVLVTGTKLIPKGAELNVGESGLGLRLISGVLSVHEGSQMVLGEGSILSRDQSFFSKYFSKYGVDVLNENNRLPIQLKGRLKGGEMVVDGSQSSQYISGLLMGLPLLEVDSVLIVENSKSTPYIDMTIRTLKVFGIEIINKDYKEYHIKGNQKYKAINYNVESDWSAASCWLSAAAIGHDVKLFGLDLESLQADVAMVEVLNKAGCICSIKNGLMLVEKSDLNSFSFDATDSPDLFPAIVVLAAFCPGVSTIKGVKRLGNKESDRGLVLQKEFGKLGLKIELKGDEMLVYGGSEFYSHETNSNNDHRIAMSLAIAGTKIINGLTVNGAGAVSKSYPEFWKHLNDVTKVI